MFYGDNLPILREHIPDQSIDLVYLDPPFNSNRSYNVLFKEESGQDSEVPAITAFDDTWHWGEQAEELYAELVTETNGKVGQMISALRGAIGKPDDGLSVIMAARLVELHRVESRQGVLILALRPNREPLSKDRARHDLWSR